MAEHVLTKEKLMNAVNLVAAMTVSEIARKRNEKPTQTLLKFMASQTAEILYDTDTKLWCDGPYAVVAAYLSETERTAQNFTSQK